MNRLTYTSLDRLRREIRLFQFDTSSNTQESVSGSLKHVSLDDCPKYAALSYVWGDAEATEKIYLNGCEFEVTVNLWTALHLLKPSDAESPFYNTPLWIDAICVNQADIPERNSQVSLMGCIYGAAQLVIAWLGPAEGQSDAALATIRSIAPLCAKADGDTLVEWLKDYPDLLDDEEGSLWHACSKIWEREYWRRVWTFQETVLAEKIIILCGSEAALWGNILAIDAWAERLQNMPQQPDFIAVAVWRKWMVHKVFDARPVYRNNLVRRLWHQQNAETEVKASGLSILKLTFDLQATDPRDYVYGLLGLMATDIIPDYSKSVETVYIDVGLKYLYNHGLGETLHYSGLARESTLRLPSFLPDWSNKKARRRVLGTIKDVKNHDVPSFRIENHSVLKMKVSGELLDQLQDSCSNAIDDTSNSDMNTVLQVCEYCISKLSEHTYVTNIPILQAIMMLVLCNKDVLHDRSTPEIPSLAFFELGAAFVAAVCGMSGDNTATFEQRCSINLPKLGLGTAGEDFSKAFSTRFLGATTSLGPWKSATEALYADFAAVLKVTKEIWQNLAGNRIFRTRNGYLCLAPQQCQFGDILCILDGCQYHIILRETMSHYQLVGTCFVQGLTVDSNECNILYNVPTREIVIF
ncbi:MAG: hypothetical protein FE78DRAFT_84111 [Acidomyces sp. 'richmondensis']|nr:MAG: hypothetical protein FE78DRAFT_84111 [Acidomyces sp. 'richmondensis']